MSVSNKSELTPPLKWAGGKRWLVPELEPMWLPYKDSRLVEPFAGGLAVTLGLKPRRALINDINPYLINFYTQLRDGLEIKDPPWKRRLLKESKNAKVVAAKTFCSPTFTSKLLTLVKSHSNHLDKLFSDSGLKESKKEFIKTYRTLVVQTTKSLTENEDFNSSLKESFSSSEVVKQLLVILAIKAPPANVDTNWLVAQPGYKDLIQDTIDDAERRHAFKCLRDEFNSLIKKKRFKTPEMAALFYYLNRTCFNGLCRFNSAGEFNVPFGRYRNIGYKTDFSEYAAAFRQWDFACGDFDKLDIKQDDFLYCDPPYDTPFTKYSEEDFTWSDQKRLVKWMLQFDVPMVLSNQATDRIVDLYASSGFQYKLIDAPRRISSSGNRKSAKEIVAWRNLDDKRR